MNSVIQRYQCLNPFDGGKPPELYAYPPPQHPVRLLFIGWNPPKRFGGFWSLDMEDNLRTEIHSILTSDSINRIKCKKADGNFLTEFLNTGHYFLHAVKCWTEAVYPGHGRGKTAPKVDRDSARERLHYCAETHLRDELQQLAPQKVCALGELSYHALCHLFPVLDKKAKPTQGKCFNPPLYKINWPLLYTCFPSSSPCNGKSLKQYTRDHLEKFLQG